MALVYRDRTRETSTSAGTGNFTLAGAQSGFQRFSDHMAVGDTCFYTIVGPNGTWETGIGTMTAANVIARTQVLESSSGDATVNFTSGTKDVFMSFPALAKWGLQSLPDISGPGFYGRVTGDGSPLILNRAQSRSALGVGATGGQLMDAADIAAARTALGVGAAGGQLMEAANAAAARSVIDAGRPALQASGGQGNTTVTTSWTPLAFFDFVATSPHFFSECIVNTAGTLVTMNTEIRLFQIGQQDAFAAGPRAAATLASNGDSALSFMAYNSLVPGTNYRARIYSYIVVGGSVVASSQIGGGCV